MIDSGNHQVALGAMSRFLEPRYIPFGFLWVVIGKNRRDRLNKMFIEAAPTKKLVSYDLRRAYGDLTPSIWGKRILKTFCDTQTWIFIGLISSVSLTIKQPSASHFARNWYCLSSFHLQSRNKTEIFFSKRLFFSKNHNVKQTIFGSAKFLIYFKLS